ncbi:MAG: HD domain-containing protein, partial [Geobacteraceae bacterium]|nr:HD domain-containing protein [Geobacteraceae bacterium]
MKHTIHVPGFIGSHNQLAEEMGDLYYDSLADLLGNLGDKMKRDAASDHQRGRMKLSTELAAAADHLYGAAERIAAAWLVCKPRVIDADYHDRDCFDRLLLLARVIAEKAHDGQFDKSGNPYISHPLAVMSMADTGIDKIVAILHDVVEDSDISMETIRNLFGDEVGAAVDAITRSADEDPEAYYARVRDNDIALRVKHLDLKHN